MAETVALVLSQMLLFQMVRSQVWVEGLVIAILSTQLLTRRVCRQFIQISTELFPHTPRAYIASDISIGCRSTQSLNTAEHD